MIHRGMKLVYDLKDGALTEAPRPKATVKTVSTRKCSKCRDMFGEGRVSEVIVLYRNDVAVDYCKDCWAGMPDYLKKRAANVVIL